MISLERARWGSRESGSGPPPRMRRAVPGGLEELLEWEQAQRAAARASNNTPVTAASERAARGAIRLS